MGMPLVGFRHPNACETQSLAPTQALLPGLLILSLVSYSSLSTHQQPGDCTGNKGEIRLFFSLDSAIPVSWEGFSNMSKGLVRRGRSHWELPVHSYPLQLANEEGQQEPKERCSHTGTGQGY